MILTSTARHGRAPTLPASRSLYTRSLYMTSSYPRVDSSVNSSVRNPRTCTDLPMLPLPDELRLPDLPSRQRPLEFVPGYNLTTHLIPAASPRYSYQEPRKYTVSSSVQIPNDPPADSAPKEARRKWANEKRDALIQKRLFLQHARESTLPTDLPDANTEPVLWNVVNRYARTSPKDSRDFGLTVIVCHANGLHKEVSFDSLRLC
jgi:hypothetical protein